MSDQIRPDRGRHAAVCRSIQFQAPKDVGKSTQVVISFELTDEADADHGVFISYFGSLSDAAIAHTVKALAACGWTGDDLSELPALAETGALSEPVELVVDHEEYDGTWRAKVKWVNQPGGGGKIKLDRPVEGGALADYGARMKSAIRAARNVSGARPSPRRATPPTTQRPPANGGGHAGRLDDVPPPDDW